MATKEDYVAELLLDTGLIDRKQFDEAQEAADHSGRSVTSVLVASGAVTQKDVTKAIANQYGMETISLADLRIPPEIIQEIPRDIARRYKVVPISKQDSSLTVAIADPNAVDTLDVLSQILECSVDGVVAPRDEIETAIKHYYGSSDETVENMLQEMTEGEIELPSFETVGIIDDTMSETEDDAPIIKLVSLIILEAFRNRASDIHLEPLERRFRVRYRIDGVCHEVENPPKRLQSAVMTRCKIMARMSIAEKRVPQDGRIMIHVMGRTLDLRVSCIPTHHGESIVMRILDKQSLMLGLPELGFLSDDQEIFEQLIQLPDGILLVTGPTGSGKTTTLYAVLNYINRPDRKIITVEDPVEYQLSGINQVHVQEAIGLTFGRALRSMLRQAPNVILIGEIRDLETAEIAVNASLTGHLCFSTLHTNDAPSAITRLIDIGVKPFLVASSIRGLMAQRLVRRVCKNCAEPYEPGDRELRVLRLSPKDIEGATFRKGRGCSECSMTGYRGRWGIFEIFLIDDDVRKMIYEKVSSVEIREYARGHGMRTLREDGLRKAFSGMTTLEEIARVTISDEG